MRTVILAIMTTLLSATPSEAGSFERAQRGYERVRGAFDTHLAEVEAQFKAAKAAWPPRGIFLRAFKDEGTLELWAEPLKSASNAARVLVRSFPICASSGVLGPKRRSGDGQVPEGFYTIDRFNPRSSYHLSLGIDYPNAVDKTRAAGDPPGGDIFIHGNCVTIGCLPLQDGPIEALYVIAVKARDNGQKQIPVHLFPCRFGSDSCRKGTAAAAARDPELAAFWTVLEAGYHAFETTKVPPHYLAKSAGYALSK